MHKKCVFCRSFKLQRERERGGRGRGGGQHWKSTATRSPLSHLKVLAAVIQNIKKQDLRFM